MLKDRTKFRLFLLLCVIIFTLVALVGCYNPDDNEVNATYIQTLEAANADTPFKVVKNRSDLVTLLKSDTPEKYDDDFFATKSLCILKIVEPSIGNISEIESYTIEDETLNVYIETKQYGTDFAFGHWWFILELSKAKVGAFENVKVFKNFKEDAGDTEKDLVTEAKECYLRHLKVDRPEASIEDVVMYRYLGIYGDSCVASFAHKDNCVFLDVLIQYYVEGLNFSHSQGDVIWVYNNGNLTTLHQALILDFISYDDLVEIHQMFIEKDTANLINKAREEYLNRYVKSKREDAVIEDVVLDEYLGTYKGVVVCVFSDKKSVFTEPVLQFKIEDLVFTWSYGYDILVYDGTGFMDLQMAYNNSKLTYEDLLNIHKLSQ